MWMGRGILLEGMLPVLRRVREREADFFCLAVAGLGVGGELGVAGGGGEGVGGGGVVGVVGLGGGAVGGGRVKRLVVAVLLDSLDSATASLGSTTARTWKEPEAETLGRTMVGERERLLPAGRLGTGREARVTSPTSGEPSEERRRVTVV